MIVHDKSLLGFATKYPFHFDLFKTGYVCVCVFSFVLFVLFLNANTTEKAMAAE